MNVKVIKSALMKIFKKTMNYLGVYMILNTERYEYLIYTWGYGVEFKDLYGEPITYACPEIKRRITEALLMDERIIDVTDFEFDYSNKGEIHTSFTVNTIYGDLEEETVVNN